MSRGTRVLLAFPVCCKCCYRRGEMGEQVRPSKHHDRCLAQLHKILRHSASRRVASLTRSQNSKHVATYHRSTKLIHIEVVGDDLEPCESVKVEWRFYGSMGLFVLVKLYCSLLGEKADGVQLPRLLALSQPLKPDTQTNDYYPSLTSLSWITSSSIHESWPCRYSAFSTRLRLVCQR